MPSQSLQMPQKASLWTRRRRLAEIVEVAGAAALITLVSSARSTMHLPDDNRFQANHAPVCPRPLEHRGEYPARTARV